MITGKSYKYQLLLLGSQQPLPYGRHRRSKRLSTTNRPTVRNHHLKLDGGFWYISHKIILDLPVNYHGHKLCPSNFPARFYWYGGKRHSPGCPPKWVAQMMALGNQSTAEQTREEVREPEPSEAGVKGSSSGSTAADCYNQDNQEVSADSQEIPSKKCPKRQLKKDHPHPAAPKKTRTRKVVPPARYSQ